MYTRKRSLRFGTVFRMKNEYKGFYPAYIGGEAWKRAGAARVRH